MANLSNINDLFEVESTGAIKFSNQSGTSGQVLKSNGNSAPTWVDASTVIGGPYLPLTGGTLTGNLVINGSNSLTVGGALSGTSATFTGDVTMSKAAPTLEISSTSGGTASIILGRTADTKARIKAGDALAGDLTFSTGGSRRLEISSSGVVKIEGSENTLLRLISTDANVFLELRDNSSTNGNFIGTIGNTMPFYTNNTLALTLDASQNATFAGNVGIGGTPGQNLDIQKSGARFRLIDGTNQLNMGLWDGANYRFEGDANRPIYMTSYQGNINFGISGGTTMTIQSGKVGIGVTSPTANLHVQSTSTATLKVITTGVADASVNIQGYDAGVHIGDATNGLRWAIWNDGPSTSSSLKFGSYALGTWYNDSSQVVTMTSSGSVGIGTTSPSSRLSISGSQAAIDLTRGTAGDSKWGFSSDSTALYIAELSTGSTDYIMTLKEGTGNIGIGTTSPNKKLTVYGGNDNGIWIDSQGAQYTSLAFGHNGTEKANIAWDNTNGYTNISTYSNGHLAMSTGGSINAFLNSSGNFGIGTTAPNFKLHVASTGADTLLRIQNTTTNRYPHIRFTAAGAEYDIGVGGTGTATGYVHNLYVYDITNSAPRIVLTQAGRVGIGTTTPGRMLDVNGGSTQDGGIKLETTATASNFWAGIEMKTPNATSFIFTPSGDSTGTIKFLPASSVKASLNATSFICAGDIVAYGSPSDITLKKNIKPLENSLDKIKNLQGVSFTWKKPGLSNIVDDIGFIAQDVKNVLPTLVRENENGKLSMRHQGVIPILVEAIKELEARVKELENK